MCLFRSLCDTYLLECKTFIELAQNPALLINCSAVINGIQQYPSTNQAIITILGSPQITSPNALTTTNTSWVTTCPSGFVVPDDPSDVRVINIPGTNCAMQCIYPLYTIDEYDSLDLVGKVCDLLINMLGMS